MLQALGGLALGGVQARDDAARAFAPTLLSPQTSAAEAGTSAMAAPSATIPGAATAQKLNERFAKRPSSVDNAVLVHQWNGWSSPQELWARCPDPPADGAQAVCTQDSPEEIAKRRERISATVLFKGLRDRVSPKQLPLFTFENGVVLRTAPGPHSKSYNKVLCAYGADAGTDYSSSNHEGRCYPTGENGCVPGCGQPPEFCNASDPMTGSCRCGFDWCDGRPQPWSPNDLGALLEAQEVSGGKYAGLGSFTGYNEVIVDAAFKDDHLPYSIEAFFYVEGCNGQEVLGRKCSGRDAAAEAQAALLAKFAPPEAEAAPLLRLRPTNWDAPFEVDEMQEKRFAYRVNREASAAGAAETTATALRETTTHAHKRSAIEDSDFSAEVPTDRKHHMDDGHGHKHTLDDGHGHEP